MMNTIRVRFAPSPTGYLHIGGLRTALFNWLFARHNKGKFLIRIEDTDVERSKQEYTDSILASLAWTGIESDEAPVIQSQRIDEHKKIIEYLLEHNKAYRCFCAPEEIIERNKKRYGADYLFSQYDEFCRTKKIAVHDKRKSHVIRFALPHDVQEVVFDDLIRGSVSFALEQFDDFIIARSDGRPMYNFVVVIDDAFMRISHVIRGEDHISNTPKQILLYQACGYAIPHFAHLPLILGPSGDRLSKRDAATSVLEYKQQGYLPAAFINYLVRLGWSHGDQELFASDELINYFSLGDVSKKGAIFDQQKLDWLNGVYIRQTAGQDIADIITRDIMPSLYDQLEKWNEQQILGLIALYKQRAKTLLEIAQELIALHKGPITFDENDIAKWITTDIGEYLPILIQRLEQQESFISDDLSDMIKQCSKEWNIKLVQIAQPIRIALVGKTSSPGIFELLALLGKQESIHRLQNLLMFLNKQKKVERG